MGVTVSGHEQTGNRLADLEAVYREHHAFVWRTLHHFGLRGDATADALQEVFLVVHRRWSDYDGKRSIKNWLYGIARRVASDHRKKGQRQRARLRLVPDPDGHAPGHDQAATLDRVSAGQLVRRFLDGLDEDKRQVFVLAEIEGMTAPEIATMLSVNLNTIYARLRAARIKFAAQVQRHETILQREQSWTR